MQIDKHLFCVNEKKISPREEENQKRKIFQTIFTSPTAPNSDGTSRGKIFGYRAIKCIKIIQSNCNFHLVQMVFLFRNIRFFICVNCSVDDTIPTMLIPHFAGVRKRDGTFAAALNACTALWMVYSIRNFDVPYQRNFRILI